jgi:hypothetical protein
VVEATASATVRQWATVPPMHGMITTVGDPSPAHLMCMRWPPTSTNRPGAEYLRRSCLSLATW